MRRSGAVHNTEGDTRRMDFLGRIRKLDSSLQRGLDNSFARVFGGKVVPNELEECLKQEIEDFLMQDADGTFLAPNDFRIGVSSKDFANLTESEPSLPENLADRMTRYCRNNGYSLEGSVHVYVGEVTSLHTGQLKTASQFQAQPDDTTGYIDGEGNHLTPTIATPSQGGSGEGSGDSYSFGHEDQGKDPFAAPTQSPDPHRPLSDAPLQDLPSQDLPKGPLDPVIPGAAAAGAGAAGAFSADSWSLPSDSADADFEKTSISPAAGSLQQPPADERTVSLLLLDGSNRTFTVKHGSNIIGRGTASDFRLPDTGVSRQHAELNWDGRDAILVDLRSTNGTMVNDTPVENWLLAEGDIISVGHSVLEVRIR